MPGTKSIFRRLIDPARNSYARIYRAKLELLREYGFITEAKYREIVPKASKPPAPDMEKFCRTQAVNCR